MLGTYQSLLSQAQSSYSDVMAGYQNALSSQQGAQAPIQGGFGALQGQVAQTLGYGGTPWGVAAPAAQSIADIYAAQQGKTQQGLINAGLGNTTVLGAMSRGNTLDAAKAYGSLGAQLAQTYAGYQSNLGLAGLNYANQANIQNTALRNAQLDYMGRYHQQLLSTGLGGYGIEAGLQRQGMGGGGGGGPPYGGSQPSGRFGAGGQYTTPQSGTPIGNYYDPNTDPFIRVSPDYSQFMQGRGGDLSAAQDMYSGSTADYGASYDTSGYDMGGGDSGY